MYWLDYKSQSHLTIVKIDVIEAIIGKKKHVQSKRV